MYVNLIIRKTLQCLALLSMILHKTLKITLVLFSYFKKDFSLGKITPAFLEWIVHVRVGRNLIYITRPAINYVRHHMNRLLLMVGFSI